MDAEKVIKALECCGDKICKHCPNFSEDIECGEKLIKEAVELFKRQQKRIEELESAKVIYASVDYCLEDYQESLEKIELLEAEKEALIAGQETLQKALADKIAILEEIDNEINPLPFVTNFDVAIRSAKSEAYKEFAERLKQQVITIPLCKYEEHGYKAVHYEIDDLVKEMTEGSNGE